ncbi:unnamed protein product [Rotaria sp. Silwood2]|nr:unnamed protein product [Rotaria sp. Silwood2]
MSSTFRLTGGKIRDKVFAEGAILSNPITELMIGLLTTVLVQSSSTSTSIVISMVSSSSTSVTNTLVALIQSGKREEFCLAFTGATVHDMFNWLTVLILLLIEITSNMLYHLTNSITKSINLKRNPNSNPQFLTVITKSLTERIVQIECILTILVQSSSIFTSTLTSLVGLDIITLERVYSFTLGSNIGITVIGIMAVLITTSEKDIRNPLQIAFCHIFFNIIERRGNRGARSNLMEEATE